MHVPICCCIMPPGATPRSGMPMPSPPVGASGTTHSRPAAQLPMRLHAPPQLAPSFRLDGTTSPGGQAIPGPPVAQQGEARSQRTVHAPQHCSFSILSRAEGGEHEQEEQEQDEAEGALPSDERRGGGSALGPSSRPQTTLTELRHGAPEQHRHAQHRLHHRVLAAPSRRW